ncbi:LysE family translocator [Tenacibaculum dicentrarchi]|uniref:LysE family translocator n=1 Tax=Tenacibaculum dicentrarchi TaxID=669041 RepID=UPI000CCB479F|nr:LysE family translocator [Tenacibaculum dicentrarchi]MCD8415854.1 LysE family translocator [Tenacibaculum dicentrarchi]MCD8420978.1 LysE family translocator [Tenacibaculum dicentrarchi]MCD8438148.1 LysE family translocator [Tenacibaculum dicentrarchi]MCD8452463.1 LysE family translocator [Tenacibaculum dicentrarchi]
MIGIENFTSFIVVAFIFVITPGIDTVFVLTKSITYGKKSGFYAGLGINTGVLSHTFFAAVGLSVLLSKSVFAFTILKYIGVIYLIYLGISKFKNGNKILLLKEENLSDKSKKNIFWSGFLTNILNPKVALFFLVFFPQFISSKQLDNPIPFIFLGFTFAFIGIVWYFILAFFASSLSDTIKDNSTFNKWLHLISGTVFIVMAIHMAFSKF